MSKRTMVIYHHTGSWEKDMEQVRAYHLRKGWRDIGYNYVIEYDGKIRGGRPLTISGAHARGFNAVSVGIALLGNFMEKPPTEQQIKSCIKLSVMLCKEHKINPSQLFQHKDKANTLCPGKYFPIKRILKETEDGLKPKQDAGKYWRVQTGAFSSEDNAKDYAKELNKKGIETYVVYS